MKSHLIEIVGWYGVVAIMVAYVLVSFSVIVPTGLIYQILNFTGAFGITVETYRKKDYQPFWLNLVWTTVALIAIINILIHLNG